MITGIEKKWWGSVIFKYNGMGDKQIVGVFMGPWSMLRARRSLHQTPYNGVITGA